MQSCHDAVAGTFGWHPDGGQATGHVQRAQNAYLSGMPIDAAQMQHEQMMRREQMQMQHEQMMRREQNVFPSASFAGGQAYSPHASNAWGYGVCTSSVTTTFVSNVVNMTPYGSPCKDWASRAPSVESWMHPSPQRSSQDSLNLRDFEVSVGRQPDELPMYDDSSNGRNDGRKRVARSLAGEYAFMPPYRDMKGSTEELDDIPGQIQRDWQPPRECDVQTGYGRKRKREKQKEEKNISPETAAEIAGVVFDVAKEYGNDLKDIFRNCGCCSGQYVREWDLVGGDQKILMYANQEHHASSHTLRMVREASDNESPDNIMALKKGNKMQWSHIGKFVSNVEQVMISFTYTACKQSDGRIEFISENSAIRGLKWLIKKTYIWTSRDRALIEDVGAFEVNAKPNSLKMLYTGTQSRPTHNKFSKLLVTVKASGLKMMANEEFVLGKMKRCTMIVEACTAKESAFKMKEKVTVNGKDAEITAGGKKIITQADFTFAFRMNVSKRDAVATKTLANMIENGFGSIDMPKRQKKVANAIPN